MPVAPAAILAKTQKGFEELRTGKHELAPNLRALLALVDGRQTAGRIADRLRGLGALADDFERLLQMGFIEDLSAVPDGAGGHLDLSAGSQYELLDDPARIIATREFLATTIAAVAGRARTLTFRARLRRARTLESLSYLVDEFHARVARARGAALAQMLADRARRLMGR